MVGKFVSLKIPLYIDIIKLSPPFLSSKTFYTIASYI